MRLPQEINFAELCKTIRKYHGWTQQRMAEELGAPLTTYKRWEYGKNKPDAEAAFRLCQLWQTVEGEETSKRRKKN